jgi:hypothetical protein
MGRQRSWSSLVQWSLLSGSPSSPLTEWIAVAKPPTTPWSMHGSTGIASRDSTTPPGLYRLRSLPTRNPRRAVADRSDEAREWAVLLLDLITD